MNNKIHKDISEKSNQEIINSEEYREYIFQLEMKNKNKKSFKDWNDKNSDGCFEI